MSDFFDELKIESDITDEGQSTLIDLSNKALELSDEIEGFENTLKNLKDEYKKIIEQDIPDLMSQFGVDSLKLSSGATISIHDNIFCSIIKEKENEAYEWFNNEGHSSLVKHEVSCSFGKGEDDVAKKLYKELSESGFKVNDKKSVHWQTLNAFVKEQLSKGLSLPDDLFSIFQGKKAKIKK